ncbi:putative LysR-family transcriptional regulator [[Actinomadura] parvosata subsp. kistnae]|uniref:LysR family transcriptional regulator n=1 Tax=[Actinomadura] parvosata subsp. kistnae TaxID=1909395 RepID=A0A1U9ZVW6_9ACTN|nr:LysR family transcriptional regulator [Nonomuraea sp. ATCC 55076]AQZ62088.1 LysR family transcriptional regulator [Nonomuraea sp. ATCC 55076]SPL89435.1 putative LysR-family transcriptional regulator [Actinomadura parvosata subsp. kistnae]
MREGEADLDLGTVRAFVAVTEERYFSEAAARLGISQQAVSKRIAKLESDLGLRLFSRTRSGADLTDDGRAFLPHARALVGLADQAREALRGRRRALRVDVLDTRLAPVDLLRSFHRRHQDVDVEIVTSNGLRSARDAIERGSVDAAFCRVSGPLEELGSVPAFLEPAHLLVSRGHPLAGRTSVRTAELSGSVVWMPGNVPGSEWAEFYDLLGAAFGIRIDTSGPDFGWDHFVADVGAGRGMSLVGETMRLPWHPGTVRIPLVDPVPVYPSSLLYHRRHRHPALEALIRFVRDDRPVFDPERHWLPEPDRAAFC